MTCETLILVLLPLCILSGSLMSHSVPPSVHFHTWSLQPQLPGTGSSASRMLLFLSLLFILLTSAWMTAGLGTVYWSSWVNQVPTGNPFEAACMWSLQLYLSQLQWNCSLYKSLFNPYLSLWMVSLMIAEICICCQKILALCAPMLNRSTETELWRRRKEWLYYFARQRGNTVG